MIPTPNVGVGSGGVQGFCPADGRFKVLFVRLCQLIRATRRTDMPQKLDRPNGLRTILYGNPDTVFALMMQVRPGTVLYILGR